MWTHNLDAELWFNNIYLSYCIFVFIYSDVRQRCELIYQQTASPCTICRNIVYITTQLDSYNYFWRNECISDNYWTIAGLASYFIPYEEICLLPISSWNRNRTFQTLSEIFWTQKIEARSDSDSDIGCGGYRTPVIDSTTIVPKRSWNCRYRGFQSCSPIPFS
jgi:hypothetical protein